MADLLPIATVRSIIETDLTDPALQLLMDDADAEIKLRLGPNDVVTEVRQGDGTRYHSLLRKALSVTSVTLRIGVTDYPLYTDDYSLEYNGRRLQRQQGSSPQSLPDLLWSGRVSVVYVPVDDTTRRSRLFVDLVRLAVQYDGQKSVRIGDANTQPLDYLAAKNDLFKPFLSSGRAFLI